jgi:hypothetical protein
MLNAADLGVKGPVGRSVKAMSAKLFVFQRLAAIERVAGGASTSLTPPGARAINFQDQRSISAVGVRACGCADGVV